MLALGHPLSVGVALTLRLEPGEAEEDKHLDGEALSDCDSDAVIEAE